MDGWDKLTVNQSGQSELGLATTSTLKNFSAMSTHMKNICGEFNRNHSTVYRDMALHKTDVNGQRTREGTDTGQTDRHRTTRKHNALCLLVLTAT